MPMDRGTPDLVRHCVAAVAKQYGGDTSKAFAICVAQLQKNGYLKPGTMELTAAGKAKEKEHEAEPDAAKKLKAYEKLLKANRKSESIGEARYNVSPSGKLKFEYMDEILTAETPVGTFELFRPKGGRPSNLSAWDWTSPQGKVLASGEESSEEEAMAKCQKLFDAAMAKKESKFGDFDRLMNPSKRSGFEDAPRTVARKYESVTKNESSMDAMRRLAGIGPRYADRAIAEAAAPTDKQFWAFVDEADWAGNNFNYKVINDRLKAKYGSSALKQYGDKFQQLRNKLQSVFRDWAKKNSYEFPMGDDAFNDYAAHIIGQGKAEFDAALKNPAMIKGYYRAPESFSYVFNHYDW